MKLTDMQREALQRIARHRDWCRISIDRSGTQKDQTPARQWLAKRGLIERHPELRRTWRATDAGRAALATPAGGEDGR